MKKYMWAIAGLLLLVTIATGLVFALRPQPKPKAVSHTPTIPYVAMGDSVAAGLGLQPYSDASACDRTNQSYPYVVSKKLELKLTNLACSGATMPMGVTGSQEVNQLNLPAQVDALFALPKPKFITLTIGANDVQWTKYITQCYRADCGSPDDTASIGAATATFTSNLTNFLNLLQSHYGASVPTTFVTGYYHVMPSPAASCPDLSGVNANEQVWVNQQLDSLNSAIRQAIAGYTFAHYVDINFSGHELCDTNSWVQGINDSAPYHPTSEGQNAYATQIENTVKTVIGAKIQ